MQQENNSKDRIIGYDEEGNEIHEVTKTWRYTIPNPKPNPGHEKKGKKDDSGGEDIDWHGGSIKNMSM